jgi:transposase
MEFSMKNYESICDFRENAITDKILSLSVENRRLREREREIILFMTSLILDNHKANGILSNPLIDILDCEKTLLSKTISNDNLSRRKKALIILFFKLGIHKNLIADVLNFGERTIRKARNSYESLGLESFLNKNLKGVRKFDDEECKELVFKILHTPPSEYGINRTTWTRKLIRDATIHNEGHMVGRNTIDRIIKNAGYRFRKAREVLTSNDPEYKEKLKKITGILKRLGQNDRFFSIDEFGPFAVKEQTGKRLVPPGEYPTVPQWRKSKGWLIVTAALELSTNQVTHFYSRKKDSEEMIKLLDILLKQYAACRRIYLSWDSASWHSSKVFQRKVKDVNKLSYRKQNGTPMVKLAPLPARAQFLNVIESIFGGLSEAIIKNSNYSSLDEAKNAIDMYFEERNEYFRNNPGRAGNKIWGEEVVKPLFQQGHNCKHHKWR